MSSARTHTLNDRSPLAATESVASVDEGRGNPPLLAVEHLVVGYGAPDQRPAVADVSFAVASGEIVGIVGESGSGKSTLGRALLGLLPYGGSVRGGQAVLRVGERSWDLAHAERRELRAIWGPIVGLVPQATSGALNPVKTVLYQFAVRLRAHDVKNRGEIRRLAGQSLERAGLRDTDRILLSYPHQLSGGMAQRVVIALATILEPLLLVADEPTSALDVTVQRVVLDNLSANVRALQGTCLFITHDLGIAAHYCDRVLVMVGGELVEQGPVSTVLRHPQHPYTRRLLEAIPKPPRRDAGEAPSAAAVIDP